MSTPTKWSILALLHFRRSPPLKKDQLISKEFFFGGPIQQTKMSDIIFSKFTEKYIGTTFTAEANFGYKLLFLSFESEAMHTVNNTLRCKINEGLFSGIPLHNKDQ